MQSSPEQYTPMQKSRMALGVLSRRYKSARLSGSQNLARALLREYRRECGVMKILMGLRS